MKTTLITVLAIVALYYLTLLAFGRASLARQLASDSNSTFDEYRWTNKVVVIGNVDVVRASRIFDQEGLNVKAIKADSYDSMTPYISGKDTYHYILLANSHYFPLITVEESENINEYAAIWKKSYLWCFGTWIQLENEMTGIS